MLTKSILLTGLLSLTCWHAQAQSRPLASADTIKFPVDAETKLITYSKVVQLPGVSQAELYTRAKLWFASGVKSNKEVVQADDKEAGVIQGTGWQEIAIMSLGLPRPHKLWYTVKLVVKEGRYKYEVTGFQIERMPSRTDLTPDAPGPIEGYTSIAEKKGAVRDIARSACLQLASAAPQITAAVQAGMSRPAAGKSDW